MKKEDESDLRMKLEQTLFDKRVLEEQLQRAIVLPKEIQELSETNRQLSLRINELVQKKDQAGKRISVLNEKIRDQNENIVLLKEQNQKLIKENCDLNNEVCELRNNNSEIQSIYNENQKIKSDLQDFFENAHDQNGMKFESLSHILQYINEKKNVDTQKDIMNEYQKVLKELKKTKKCCKKLFSGNNELFIENEELKRQLEFHNIKVINLENEKQNLNPIIIDNKDIITQYQKTIEGMKSKMESSSKQYDEIIQIKEKQIHDLKEICNSMDIKESQRINEVINENQSLQNMIALQKKQFAEILNKKVQYQKLIRGSAKRIQTLANEKAGLDKRLKRAVKVYETKIEKMKNDHSIEVLEQKRMFEDLNEKYNKLRNDTNETIAKIENKANDLMMKCENQSDAMFLIEESFKKSSDEIESLRSTNMGLYSVLKQFQHYLNSSFFDEILSYNDTNSEKNYLLDTIKCCIVPILAPQTKKIAKSIVDNHSIPVEKKNHNLIRLIANTLKEKSISTKNSDDSNPKTIINEFISGIRSILTSKCEILGNNDISFLSNCIERLKKYVPEGTHSCIFDSSANERHSVLQKLIEHKFDFNEVSGFLHLMISINIILETSLKDITQSYNDVAKEKTQFLLSFDTDSYSEIINRFEKMIVEIDYAQSKISKLKKVIKRSKSEPKEDKSKTKSEYEVQINKQNDFITSLKLDIENMKKAIYEKDIIIQSLNEDIKENKLVFQKEISKYDQIILEKNQELSTIEKNCSIAAAKSELTLKSFENEYGGIKTKLDGLQKKYNKLKQKHSQTKIELKKKDDEFVGIVNKHKKSTIEYRKENSEFLKKIKDFEHEVANLKCVIDDLNQQKNNMQKLISQETSKLTNEKKVMEMKYNSVVDSLKREIEVIGSQNKLKIASLESKHNETLNQISMTHQKEIHKIIVEVLEEFDILQQVDDKDLKPKEFLRVIHRIGDEYRTFRNGESILISE